MPKLKIGVVLFISFIIQLGLILYAEHVDNHPERYGGLRYTDVDWRVISDGARHIFSPRPGEEAQGWLVQTFGLKIGDPYRRATFRYTPLLPLILSPTVLHPLLGKLTLLLLSFLIPPLLLCLSPSNPWSTHILWTLNPLVMNITTRGSPEALIVLPVITFLYLLKKRRIYAAGAIWAVAVAWKLYPVIYGVAVWTYLSKRGWLGRDVWRFGASAMGTFGVLNWVLWSIWGEPFLQHTYSYHLHRLDHRHNFSPYFYPIYLSLYSDPPKLHNNLTLQAIVTPTPRSMIQIIQAVIRHPLASFVPQAGVCLVAGLVLPRKGSLELAMFVQTFGFIIFNKVCTSQYFIWFLPLLPLILRNLRVSKSKAGIMILSWVVAQGVWLGTAYQLELMARKVYLGVWMAGIGLLGVSTWVLGEVVEGWDVERRDGK